MAQTDPPDEPAIPDGPSRPAAGSFRELAIFIGLGAALLAGVGIWSSRRLKDPGGAEEASRRLASAYVGEVACRECHPGESAQYHRSGHARTLKLASDWPELGKWLDGKEGRDPEYPDAVFRYRFEDGRLGVERVATGSIKKLAIQFAFGSGEHAATFVTMTDDDPEHPEGIEHRLTVFTEPEKHLGITPGQNVDSDVAHKLKGPEGRVVDSVVAKKCFDCHSTRLSDRGSDTLDIKTLIPNVSCERCHGPGAGHVAAARRGDRNLKMTFGVGRNTPSQQMQLCGHCHRLPDMAPPGSIRPDNAELARFQPVGLMASKCYKGSGGTLTCTTCHDPHSRAAGNTATYEAACIACHEAAPQAVCKVSRSEGCVGCHMPRRDAGQRVLFADHWIRVHPEAPTASTPASPSTPR